MKKGFRKYGNRQTECISGHIHDSKGEAEYCNELYMRKAAGDIKDYRCQMPFNLYAFNFKDCTPKLIGIHKVDFWVINCDLSDEVHEFKGKKTEAFNLRKKFFESNYPDIPYKIIKAKK